MVTIGAVYRGKALLPERHAYADYFRSLERFDYIEACDAESLVDLDVDVVLLFLGWEPKWQFSRTRNGPIIVADLCLSTGRLPRLKDFTKKCLNVKPNIGVTQSVWMANVAGWQPSYTILRSQGFNPALVKPRSLHPDFDLVYAGTLRRQGVVKCIEQLGSSGFRIAVASGDSVEWLSSNVSFLGLLDQEALYEVLSRSAAGLNLVPNQRPFNRQVSTKVIEYFGAGLPLVSNRYAWIDEFTRDRGIRFLDVAELTRPEQLESLQVTASATDDLAWNEVMRKSGLAERILATLPDGK